MMKLFHFPWSRSTRAQWMLEEVNAPHELVHINLFQDEGDSPEHQKRHPHGCVPVLIDGDITIFESSAICAYLADKYIEKNLAPRLRAPLRAYYYQWLFYTSATLEGAAVDLFVQRKLRDDNERNLTRIKESKVLFHEVAQHIEATLSDRKYLLGGEFSAADIVLGCTFMWNEDQISGYSNVTYWLNRMRERPAFIRCVEKNMAWDTGKQLRAIQLAPSPF